MRYLLIIAALLVPLFGSAEIQKIDRQAHLRYIPERLAGTDKHLTIIAENLRSYKKTHGAYPTMNQGLRALTGLSAKNEDESSYESRYYVLRVTPSGVLSIWAEPYIYENRRGLPAGAFTDSGASRDAKREYSIKVDDGIYVWSLAAKQQCEKRDYLTPRLRLASNCIAAVSAICFALFVWVCWRSCESARRVTQCFWWSFKGLVAAFILSIIFLPTLAGPTCYEMARSVRRTPELTNDYLKVMRKYRDKGVISEAVYAKLAKTIKEKDSQ